MKNCKLSVTIALGCFLMASPAKANFPVCDYCELPAGVVPQITTALENLSELKTQISTMTENLRAIGDVDKTIAEFTDSFYGKDKEEVAEAAVKAVGTTYANNMVVQDKVMEIAEIVNDAHKSIINTMVSQVEEKFKIASVSTLENIKIAQNNLYTPVIEENEEETVDINEEKADVQQYFGRIKDENSQLYVKMNDLFESSISVMNEGADLNHQALSQLNIALKHSSQITDAEKAQIQEKTKALMDKEQENSDLGINLMEDIQINYGKQYQEKIADNINNYQKKVQAYIEGNITAKELREAGNLLRTEVNNVNIFEDNNVFAKYNQESEKVKSSTNQLIKDISRIWADEEDKS